MRIGGSVVVALDVGSVAARGQTHRPRSPKQQATLVVLSLGVRGEVNLGSER